MNRSYYYEISDAAMMFNPYLFTNKYYVKHWNAEASEDLIFINEYIRCSERVWEESISGVRYVKNRFESNAAVVNLKEFLWVKLRSHEILE
jgi:hypothetical protein